MESPNISKGRESDPTRFLRLAWRYGRSTERFFVVLFVFVGVFFVSISAVIALMDWPFMTFTAALLAFGSWPAFWQAQLAALYSPDFLRAAVSEGRTKGNQAYYAEMARYLDAYGVNGHLSGDVAWGLAYTGIYLAKAPSAVVITLILYPVSGWLALGAYASLEFPISLTCYLIYGQRTYRQFREAEGRGFHLLEFWPGRRGRQVAPKKA